MHTRCIRGTSASKSLPPPQANKQITEQTKQKKHRLQPGTRFPQNEENTTAVLLIVCYYTDIPDFLTLNIKRWPALQLSYTAVNTH